MNLVLRKIPNNIQVFFGNWLLPARGSLFLFILLHSPPPPSCDAY
nr:MAG TPA: hypothetical protein [Caudoviricetes sp.]